MSGTDAAPNRGRWSRLFAWYDHRRGGTAVLVGWLLTRAVLLAVLLVAERFIVGDVFYYHRKISELVAVGLPGTLQEYPTPVVWILWLPFAVTGGTATGYVVAYVALMLLLDAGFTWALWRSGGRRHDHALDFWLLFVLLIGPLTYVRFDLLPAVLAGGGLLAARRRPGLTGALTGLGAAIKLWPALLIPAFAAHRPDRRRAIVGFVVVGFGLAAISLVTGGFARLVSPLTWQSGRGLQIESVWTTPLLLARLVRPAEWTVGYSRFQAFEIFGPGVGGWLAVSNVATVVGLVTIAVLWVRAYRTPEPSAVGIGLLVLATVAIMIVTNKTLSPQYLLWLGGVASVLLLSARSSTATERRTVSRLARQLLVLALLTQVVYPVLYDGLLGLWNRPLLVLATVVTALRNLALVALAVEVCAQTWRTLGRRS